MTNQSTLQMTVIVLVFNELKHCMFLHSITDKYKVGKLTLNDSRTSIHCCFSSGLDALKYQTQSFTDTSNLQSSNS